MPRIRIPQFAFKGFDAISRLTEDQVNKFTSYLDNMNVGTKMEQINNFLDSILESDDSRNIVQALISFSELLQPSTIDFEALAASLASSYKDQFEGEVSSEIHQNLKRNLSLIFNHSESLKLTLKAIDLVSEEDYIFNDSKIITDIRLVFNDELESNYRSALLVHHLYIEYYKDREQRKIVLALDLADLKKLKEHIERAIKKDDIIKDDYSNSFNFLNLSNDDV